MLCSLLQCVAFSQVSSAKSRALQMHVPMSLSQCQELQDWLLSRRVLVIALIDDAPVVEESGREALSAL